MLLRGRWGRSPQDEHGTITACRRRLPCITRRTTDLPQNASRDRHAQVSSQELEVDDAALVEAAVSIGSSSGPDAACGPLSKGLPVNKLGLLLVLLVAASCEFPRPPDLAPNDGGTGDGVLIDDSAPADAAESAACQLTAIGPSIANTGDMITLEGTFAAEAMVNFPGGTAVPATVLGPHRAQVQVPASATAGEFTVTTCGMTVGSIPFRRASFSLGVGTFANNYDQADIARQYPTLAMQRDSHTTTICGNHAYVIGGVARAGSLSSVEHSLINADGTLGRFSLLPGISLVTPRRGHTLVTVGHQVYVLGGFNDGPLMSIERATIGSNCSLGSFTTLDEVTLTTPRQGHASIVVGNYMYAIGGLSVGPLSSVERAIIHDDGTLGHFVPMAAIKLAIPRHGHTAMVVGDYLYVVGGSGSNGALKDVERANIAADGSLGTFAAVPAVAMKDARSGHTATLIGDELYVFGGVSTSGSIGSIERAQFDNKGILGSFESVASTEMTRPRRNHTTSQIGNYLYTLGGTDDRGLIERGEHASLNASGSLSSFAIMPSISLTSERAHGPPVVLGNFLYVMMACWARSHLCLTSLSWLHVTAIRSL
jgi:hypothetical protein